MTTVVHCKKSKYDVYIGRPSVWGNPFEIDKDGTRDEVIQKYREWILTQPTLLRMLPSLKDKRLACWCKPLSCHGDVLVELLENPEFREISSLDKSQNADIIKAPNNFSGE